MNEQMIIRIREKLSSLSEAELVDVILILINEYDLCTPSDVVRIIRHILLGREQRLLEEKDSLLKELSQQRESIPGPTMRTISILNRLQDNHEKYRQLSKQLDKQETA